MGRWTQDVDFIGWFQVGTKSWNLEPNRLASLVPKFPPFYEVKGELGTRSGSVERELVPMAKEEVRAMSMENDVAEPKTNFRNRPCRELMFSHGKWDLYILPDRSSEEWKCLKLVHTDKRFKKRNYWFGWNGVRMSGSACSNRLAKDWPEIYQVILNWLSSCEVGS